MYNGANHREYHIPWIVSSIKHPMSPLYCSLQSRPGPPPEPEKYSIITVNHQQASTTYTGGKVVFVSVFKAWGCPGEKGHCVYEARLDIWQLYHVVKKSRSRVQLRNCCICIASQSLGSNPGGGTSWTAASKPSAFRLECLSRIWPGWQVATYQGISPLPPWLPGPSSQQDVAQELEEERQLYPGSLQPTQTGKEGL